MATKETTQAEDLSPKVAPEETTADSKPKYDANELLEIFDAIIFEGEYKEDVLIKNKLKVTFRSRSANETSEISREIDAKQFNLVAALQEYRAFLNLVYSLVYYNGKNLGSAPLEERKKIVGGLPAVVVAALSEALFKFDQKTDAACREGELNF